MNLSTNSPGPYDVLCCKSSEAYEHIGNRRFRALVQSHSSTYARVTQSKVLKSQVVNDIIRSIRSAGGNFLQQMKGCQGTWTVIKKNRTREKVGHALRRAVENDRKSPRSTCSNNITTPQPHVQPQQFTLKPVLSEEFNEFPAFLSCLSKTKSLSNSESVMDPFKPIDCFPTTTKSLKMQSNDYSFGDLSTLIDEALFDPFETNEPLEPLLATVSDDECSPEVASLLRDLIEI
mmetsp:Transcript_22035/g.32552  ORF Transcript_22035/g.32552 Transcript_22035/m.32552 type:complete len:233 (-) Transcript_22035:2-700(-)